MVFLPLSFSSLCFSFSFLQGGCQTETETARELLTAAVADSMELVGLDDETKGRPSRRGPAGLTGAQHLTDNSG